MNTTFALYFGNRGFFPGEVIAEARERLMLACQKNGYDYIVMDESLTRFGAVETIEEGKAYAKFLEENKGKYDGIILSLPNFGDENGASAAFSEVDVPILVHAFPDELDKMDFAHRRDSMCGKMAMCNVLRQMGVKYTLTKKFCPDPLSDDFAKDLDYFASICRVYTGMRRVNIGAIGARTTAFKTVRFDEIALQKKRINIETIDMTIVFAMMEKVDDKKLSEKKEKYLSIADFGDYPEIKLENIAKLGVVIDEIIEKYDLHAVALRCWDELQKTYGISPCLILAELNERGIAASCELDISNAVMMRAIALATQFPVILLDVNNNYGDSDSKVILFHCGNPPVSYIKGGKGEIRQHLMFKKSLGDGMGVGITTGESISCDAVTVGSLKTENGEVCSFVSEGRLTEDKLPSVFFGFGTVFEQENVNILLEYMATNGYRHHVALSKGNYADAIKEAFEKYLDYKIDKI